MKTDKRYFKISIRKKNENIQNFMLENIFIKDASVSVTSGSGLFVIFWFLHVSSSINYRSIIFAISERVL